MYVITIRDYKRKEHREEYSVTKEDAHQIADKAMQDMGYNFRKVMDFNMWEAVMFYQQEYLLLADVSIYYPPAESKPLGITDIWDGSGVTPDAIDLDEEGYPR